MGSLNVILLLFFAALVSCKEYMPVLVWSNGSTPFSPVDVSAFTKMSTSEFTNFLLKAKVQKPVILLFMEEDLSVEDFSWSDTNGNGVFPSMKQLAESANELTYFPAVHDPTKSLKNLKHHGYLWKQYNKDAFYSIKENKPSVIEVKLTEPHFLEDRPDMLRRHDEQIAEVFKEAASHNANIMAIYSGKHNSWTDTELVRSKREERDTNDTDDFVITDDKNVVRMSVTRPIIYQSQDNKVVNITSYIGNPTTDIEKDKISMTVRFKYNENPISVKFEFKSPENDWWSLDSIEILDFKQKDLTPSVPVGAPAQYSYFCNPTVVFRNGSVSMTFQNLQVQPRIGKGNSFGPIIHCIPYFSIAIWSGIVIVLILSGVLAWGIVMIMDINTNDRFDDPKGKTINITATE